MFKDKHTIYKIYCKVRDHFHYIGKYRGAAHSLGNLKYSIPKNIHVSFLNGLNYDYDLIIKELAKDVETKFNFIGENFEKYKTFSLEITEGVKEIEKNRKKITKTISYKLQYIDSTRFIAISLPDLVDNLAEVAHEIKRKYVNGNEKCETCGIIHKDCVWYLEYINVKVGLIKSKCSCCNTNYQKKFEENLR